MVPVKLFWSRYMYLRLVRLKRLNGRSPERLELLSRDRNVSSWSLLSSEGMAPVSWL